MKNTLSSSWSVMLLSIMLVLCSLVINSCDSITDESLSSVYLEKSDTWCSINSGYVSDIINNEDVKRLVEEVNYIHSQFWKEADLSDSSLLHEALQSGNVDDIADVLNISTETLSVYNDRFTEKALEINRIVRDSSSFDFPDPVSTESGAIYFSQLGNNATLLNDGDDGCEWAQVTACMALGAGGSVGLCGPFALLCYTASSYLCMCAYCSGDAFDDICV